MVNSLSIAAMVFSLLVSILVPIFLFVYFRKKYKISFKPVVIGMATFIVFAMILEQILHAVVIGGGLIKIGTIAFAIYGALAAGVFEEVGRFISMKFLLKKNREWHDGVAFGIGHGGIEAIFIGAMSGVSNLVTAQLINSNKLSEMITASSNNPAALKSLETARDTLVNTAPALFALSGVERIFAILIHMAGSILVLYAVKNKKIIYLFAAILGHALVDFFPGLYQAGKLGVIQAEVMVGLFSIGILFFIIKSKRIFQKTS